jgi:hypothetical protein
MRISVTLKLIVIPVVVYATWWTTSSLRAQQSKTVEPPAQATSEKVISAAKEPPIPAEAHVLHPKVASSIRLEASSVEVQGNFIQVHASVSMLSRYQGPSYLWRLTVTDLATDKVASDVPYLSQMFTMDPSGSMKPSFNDVVKLPSGKYGVNLTLHRIPEGFTVEQFFNDKDSLATSAAIRVLETVVIQ